MASAGFGPGLAEPEPGELARHQLAVRVVERGAHADRAAAGVHDVVHQLQGAAVRRAVGAERAHLDRDAADLLHRVAAAGQGGQGAGQRLLVGLEAGVDRIDRHQRRQHRGGGASRDEVAGRDLDAADAAGNGGADLGVAEVEAGGRQVRLGGAQVGLGGVDLVHALVHVALRREAGADELLGTPLFLDRERQAGDGGGDLGFGVLDIGGVGSWVDGEQQVALLDDRAFAEVRGDNGASGPGADLDAADGFDATGEVVPDSGVALLDGRNRDGHRDRGGCGGGRGGSAGQDLPCGAGGDRGGQPNAGRPRKPARAMAGDLAFGDSRGFVVDHG